ASGLALSEAGVSPGDDIDCPKTVTVGGKEFKNAEDEVLGDISFAKNFAQSCNTAFVSSGEDVTGDEVADAAAQLGMTGALGIGAKMASVPAADYEVTHAAQMIGQGKVQASPLAVATMAASVQAGETVTPRLVLGDALGDSGADAAGDDDADAAPALDEDAAQEISDMMGRTVTGGTATKLKDVPGGQARAPPTQWSPADARAVDLVSERPHRAVEDQRGSRYRDPCRRYRMRGPRLPDSAPVMSGAHRSRSGRPERAVGWTRCPAIV